MISGARQLLSDESGLTLIELLVVTLVIAVLAAIAIPAVGNQTRKAKDTGAKLTAQSAAVAMETCNTESLGSYEFCDLGALQAIDPTLPDKPTLKLSGVGTSSYTVVVQSDPTSQKFRVKRDADGTLSFPCTKKGVGGCPRSGDWDG